MSMFRCLSCNEMIFVDAGACRFCGSGFEPAAAQSAAAQQEWMTQLVAGANQFKLGPYFLPFFAIGEAVLLFGPIFSLKLLFLALVASPAAVASSWIWLSKTRAIETRDPDFAGARAAMKRTLYLSLGMLAVQLLILGVYFARA